MKQVNRNSEYSQFTDEMHANVDKLIYEYAKGSAVKLQTTKCYWFVHFLP